MQLPQAGDRLVQGCGGGQVENQGGDLGAQEVVGAGGAEGGQAGMLGAGEEVQHGRGVGEVADLGDVGGGQTADDGGERGGAPAAFGLRQGLVAVNPRAERLGLAVAGQEGLGGADDVQGVGLALLAGGAPGGDAVTAEDAADGLRVGPLDLGDVQAELEAGAAPGQPRHGVAEAGGGEPFAVGGGGERDPGVGVQVVDVGGVDQTVHGGVDGRSRAALAVQAVLERGDHLVLLFHARVGVGEGAQAVQPQHGQARLGESAEVTAGALHPQQVDGLPRDGVGGCALGRGVAAGVVGVARIRSEPVGAGEEGGDDGVLGHGGSNFLVWWRCRSRGVREEGTGRPVSTRWCGPARAAIGSSPPSGLGAADPLGDDLLGPAAGPVGRERVRVPPGLGADLGQ